MQHQESLRFRTRGRGLVEITREVARVVSQSGVATGLVTVFCRHTSASLVIQENADPSASRDLVAWLGRLAPDGDREYEHRAEGPDDMASHLRSAVTRTSEAVPVHRGEMVLGTWQGIFLLEHRHAPRTRDVVVHVSGD